MNIAATALIDQLLTESDHLKKAQLVDSLRRDGCLSVKEIAEHLHKHPSYISHLNRLLKLPPIVIDGYYAHQVSLSHLVILSRLNDKKEMEKVYTEILSKGLTSNQTEELIRMKKFEIEGESDKLLPAEVTFLTERIEKAIDKVKIKVIQTRIKGKIVLELKGNNKVTTEFLRTILTELGNTTEPIEERKGDVLMTLE